jgi:hypothetical protein
VTVPLRNGYYLKRSGEWPHWTFEIPVLREGRVLIRFSCVWGKLCSGGFLGKLEKRNGRWLVTRWQRLWLS